MGSDTLLEPITIQDVYVQDVHHIEVFGENARIVFFRWRLAEDGVTWQKVAAEVAIVRPVRGLPLHKFPVVIVRDGPAIPRPDVQPAGLH